MNALKVVDSWVYLKIKATPTKVRNSMKAKTKTKAFTTGVWFVVGNNWLQSGWQFCLSQNHCQQPIKV